MRKFILAGLLALPFLAFESTPAFAGGCCNGCGQSPTLNFGFGMRIGIHHWCFCEHPTINPCLPGKCHKHKQGCNTGCATGGCGGGDCDNSCQWGAGAPWYLFWPQDAHFRMPAPTGYPYWPRPQTIQPGFNPGGPGCYGYNMPMPGYNNMAYNMPMPGYNTGGYNMPMPGYMPNYDANANAVQPAGFYPQAPAYWYGR